MRLGKAVVRWAGIMEAMSDTFYDAVGGEPTFRRLVERFYAGVAGDPDLRPLYPEADLAPAAERLQMFLEQYWGGPHTYSDQRGHPRLRMRHAPFPVTPKARDSWLRHMRDALDGLELAAHHEAQLWGYLQTAADMMVNTPDDGDPSVTRSTRPASAPAMMPPGPAPITLRRPADPPTSAG